MKRSIISYLKNISFATISALCLLSALCSSCSDMRHVGSYNIEGVVGDSTMNGIVVDITIPLVDAIQDSTVIKNGKFKMKGKLPANTIYQIRIRNKAVAYAATEKGERVKIKFAKQGGYEITSGKYSMELYNISEQVNEKLRRFMLLSRNLNNKELVDEENVNFRREMEQVLNQCVFDNRDNILGVYGVWQLASNLSIESTAQLDSLASMVTMAGSCPIIMAMRERVERIEATQPGEMFVDFDCQKRDGESARISDYVGRGDYTLMFIWASWLPSCWNEMEYLRRAYAKYGNRGLKIVAANVYDKRSDFDYIYDSERFPWSMVYVEDGKAATALYGIRSIPYIMLFDSNGVVVSRGLREEQIEDLLSSIRLK